MDCFSLTSTPRKRKLEGLDGQVFLDETEDTYCVWRAQYSKRSRICTYCMDIFRLNSETGAGTGNELHLERAYTIPELTGFLEQAGFRDDGTCWQSEDALSQIGGRAGLFCGEKGFLIHER